MRARYAASSRAVTVSEDATLTIKNESSAESPDESPDVGTIIGRICVNEGGTLSITRDEEDEEAEEGEGATDDPGVIISGGEATIQKNANVEITGNKAGKNGLGGGVCNAGTFKMNGGAIYGNSAGKAAADFYNADNCEFTLVDTKGEYNWYEDKQGARYPDSQTLYDIPDPDSAEAEAETWLAAEVPLTGDGTADDPCQIETAQELAAFRDIVNGNNGGDAYLDACAELTQDIPINKGLLDEDGELSDNSSDLVSWEPIGTKPYTGTFDGQGCTISGLYCNRSDSEGGAAAGLFGAIGKDGKVQGLNVADSYVSAGGKGDNGESGDTADEAGEDGEDGEAGEGYPTTGIGGGTPTYRPDVEQPEGGEVSVSPRNPRRGDDVTVTAEPEEGYEVDEVIVTDRNGNEVAVTDNGDGTFSFTQPSGKVTIQVTFRETEPEPLPFADVSADHWAHDAIRYVWEHGLMAGTGADAFEPDAQLTRAMMATVLWAMEGGPVADYLMDFPDVDEDAWYAEAIRWAASEGIAGGYGGGIYGPENPITREQMAVMLYAYAVRSGLDVSVGGDTNILSYADALDVSDWAISALQWVCGAGVIGGKPGGVLDPAGTATRAEVAVMLMQFCELDK